jgi:hypothetical protein
MISDALTSGGCRGSVDCFEDVDTFELVERMLLADGEEAGLTGVGLNLERDE